MYMFLPFSLALAVVLCVMTTKKEMGYTLWLALTVVTYLSFKYHTGGSLNLSF